MSEKEKGIEKGIEAGIKTENRKGIVVVISGFSGAGKGTVIGKLLQKNDHYALSISVTTRKMREGEEEGKHYFFRDEETFLKLANEGKLLEYNLYGGKNYYGTPREYVQERLCEGKDVILEIDPNGARQVKKNMPEAVLIFITPPHFDDLEKRLTGRNTETPEQIAQRLKIAAREALAMPEYDHILVNREGASQDCADQLEAIVQAEHLRTEKQQEHINALIEQSAPLREEHA